MGRRNRVLLVERERATREVLAIALRTLGYEVVTARDLSDVLHAMASTPPALAVVDFLRPAAEIHPLLSALRAKRDTSPAPAVLALVDPHEARDPAERAQLRSLVDATLDRPVEPERLARTAESLLADASGT